MQNIIKRACSILLVFVILFADFSIIRTSAASADIEDTVINRSSFSINDLSKLGKPLFVDTLFEKSDNGMTLYGQGDITLEKVAREESCPTASAYMMKIITSGTTNHGLGGFKQLVDVSEGGVYYHAIVAKIPQGYTLESNHNSIGYEGKQVWLTDNVGTGEWETYVYKTTVGLSFEYNKWGNNFGHVYLRGEAATAENPVIWHVAYADVFDATGEKAFADSFDEVDNNIKLYNNKNNDAVTLEKVPVGEDCPTINSYMYKISTLGTSRPYMGGFKQRHIPIEGRTYYHKFLAKIPVGYKFEKYSNPISGTFEWVTDNKGTGEWETYLYKLTVDKHAINLREFGYVALLPNAYDGSAFSSDFATKSRVTWYLAYSNIFEAYDADYVMQEYTPVASKEYGGHTYVMYNKNATWDEANTFCASIGGHLATATSAGEKDIIVSLQTETSIESCWLGASDASQEGQWTWVTGEPFSYSYWGNGQPDNSSGIEHYLESWGTGSSWNDDTKTKMNPGFVCEFEGWYIPAKTIEYKDHIYSLYNDALTWTDAKTECEKMGGHLVTITDEKEQEAVEALLNYGSPHKTAYIGATDKQQEGVWTWVTGEQFVYNNWDENEPSDGDGNQDYGSVYLYASPRDEGKWDDYYNDGKIGFICEVETSRINSAAQVTYNGNCYLRYDTPISWCNADAFAKMIGGHLVTITSQEEQNAINGLLSGAPKARYWIGAEAVWNNSTHRFTWVTGEGNTYKNWEAGEPNRSSYMEFFSSINTNTLKWNDLPNSFATTGFIVEIENAQGSHGDISWQYDGYELIINGTGDISDFESIVDGEWFRGVRKITVDENNYTYNSNTFRNTLWYRSKPNGIVYRGNEVYSYKGTIENNSYISITEGATSITSGAFANQTGLCSVSIPSTVSYIGQGAFDGCKNLSDIEIKDGNPVYSSYNKAILSKDRKTFVFCALNYSGEYRIPTSVIRIADGAFKDCVRLTGVELHEDIESIGKCAFENCTSLTNLNMPNKISQIGDRAFKGCIGLEKIVVPNGVTYIGNQVFSDCDSLSQITIGKPVDEIDATAFNNSPIERIYGYYGSTAYEFALSNNIEFIPYTSVLSFEANGGEISQSSLTVNNDYPLGQLPVAEKENCVFAGWFTSEVGGEQITQDSVINEDTTVFAHWEERSVVSISISSLPGKTTYYVGDYIDASGLILNANYNSGEPEHITSGFSCLPGRLLKPGEQTIAVNYGGAIAEYKVDVYNVSPTSIRVEKLPLVTTYYVGDLLNTKGLKIRVNYSNGTQAIISDPDNFVISYDFSESGSRTVSIAYSENGIMVNTQFTVTVLSSSTVYSYDATVNVGERIAVPICISNNTGIMGFLISLTYDDSILTMESVSPSEMLSNGSINYNSLPGSGKTDIVWTGSSEIVQNGILFTAYFTVSDSVKGDCDINISYSQGDTFNESYNDVRLICRKATITVENESYVEPARMYIEDVCVEQGESFYMPVKISNNHGISVTTVTISYDSLRFKPTNVVSNLATVLGTNIDSSNGSLMIILNSLPSNVKDGDLFTVSFETKSGTEGECEFSISNISSIECKGAKVTISNNRPKEPTRVYADEIKTKSRLVDIPICIADNDGIMGFKLTLNYNDELLHPVSARAGELLSSGIFEDSIDSSENGSFDIVWNNSFNIKGEGTIAVVSFEIISTTFANFEITVENNENDTFDEDWKTIELVCPPIEVSYIDLCDITVYTPPRKTNYFVGESFEIDGLELALNYSDGSTEIVDSGFSYKEMVFSETGNQQINVSCLGKNVLVPILVDKLVIKSSTRVVYLGNSLKLSAEYLLSDEQPNIVSWISNDKTVAVVDENGFVTANGIGNAWITAIDQSGNSAEYKIQILSDVKIGIYNNNGWGYSQKIDWWKRYSSATMQLRYTSSPCPKNVRFIWSSDNPKVKIDENGIITNVGSFARSAIITLSAYDVEGRVIAKSSVRVSFYKFKWQRSRLQAQSVANDDFTAWQNETNPVLFFLSKLLEFFIVDYRK